MSPLNMILVFLLAEVENGIFNELFRHIVWIYYSVVIFHITRHHIYVIICNSILTESTNE